MAVAALVACSGNDPEPVTGPPQTMRAPARHAANAAAVPTPDTAQPDPTAQAVLDAYLGYWRAYQAVNDPPAPRDPRLREHATGAVYEASFRTTEANQLAGRALRLPAASVAAHRAEVVSVTATSAVVRDCAVDDLLVVDARTGAVLDDTVVTRLGTATLVLEDGRWKVAATEVHQRWEGVGECAA